MADRYVIGEIDIEMDKAISDTSKLAKNVQDLKNEYKLAESTTGKFSNETIKAKASYDAANTSLKEQQRTLKTLTQSQNEEIGTIKKLELQNAALRAEQKKLNLETAEGAKRNREIVSTINKNTETIKGNSDEQKKGWLSVGQYTQALNQFVPGANAATGAAQNLGTGLKIMLGPIGLLIAAFGAIITYFKHSEEGQNKLNVVVAAGKAIFNDLMDTISSLGETIVNAFENPIESAGKIWDAFVENIKNRATGLFDIFKNLGTVISGVLDLDFDKIKTGLAGVGESTVQVLTGVDNLTEKITTKIKEYGKSLSEEVNKAMALQKQLNDIDKLVRENTVKTAKENLELSRLKNQVENKNINDLQTRLKLLEDENKILDEQQERQLKIANSKYEIQKAQNALGLSTKEDLEAEAQLLAEVYQTQQSIEDRRRETITKRQEIENQIKQKDIEDARKTAEEKVAAFEYELSQWKLTNEDKITFNEDLYNKELELLDIKHQNNLIKESEYNLARAELTAQFEESEQARKIEAEAINYENEKAILEGRIFEEFEMERQALDRKMAQEIAYAKKIGADTTKIEEKFSKAKRQIATTERDAKLALAAGLANDIAVIAGENTKVGKAAAVAATTIDTFRSAVSAYAGMVQAIPGPIGIIAGAAAAAASVISGIATVKKILAVPTDVKSGGGSPSGGGGASYSAPTTSVTTGLSSANTEIGQGIVSRNTNIETQTSNQTQIAVVVDDVTASQQMSENNNKLGTL